MENTKRELRGIRLTGAVASANVRLASLLGVEHVVAPIVLLVGDSVIFPINAEHPEFVPADVLSIAPAGWNGRPAMSGDHPSEEGAMVSANIPLILEGHSCGQLFNVRFEGNRLLGDVWINPTRAAAVPDGLEILQRVNDGDPVEISVGAFVVVERVNGTHNGREYGSIWREITPDHVALLREGLIGACSIEMGCGTPRAAVHHMLEGATMRSMSAAEVGTLTTQVQERVQLRAAAAAARTETTEAAVEYTPETRAKLVTFLGSEAALVAAAGTSDSELRDMLMDALKRVEPQVLMIASVVPDDKTCVYLIDPDPGGPTPLKPYQRSYSIAADGTSVTFSDERTPVRRREEWVPVTGYRSAEETAAPAQTAQRGACGCGGNHRAAGAEGASMTVNAERITALITNPRSPFEEADRAYLESLSADRIAAAEAKAAEPTQEAAAATGAAAGGGDAADADTVTVSAAELGSLRAMAAERDRTRNAQKRVLVGKLKVAQTTYNEQRLNGMELEMLQEVAALLQLDAPQSTDFVALERSIEEPAAAVEAPKPYSLAVAKRNGAAS